MKILNFFGRKSVRVSPKSKALAGPGAGVGFGVGSVNLKILILGHFPEFSPTVAEIEVHQLDDLRNHLQRGAVEAPAPPKIR